MTLDSIESLANAAIGLLVSVIAVHVLRAVGWWDAAPAASVALLFFGLSWGRSRALRAIFRRADDAR